MIRVRCLCDRLLPFFFHSDAGQRWIEVGNLPIQALTVEGEAQLEPAIVAEFHPLGAHWCALWRKLADGKKSEAYILLTEYLDELHILRVLDSSRELAVFCE